MLNRVNDLIPEYKQHLNKTKRTEIKKKKKKKNKINNNETRQSAYNPPKKKDERKKESASSVNRTRASSMATTNSTTRPTMLVISKSLIFEYIREGENSPRLSMWLTTVKLHAQGPVKNKIEQN